MFQLGTVFLATGNRSGFWDVALLFGSCDSTPTPPQQVQNPGYPNRVVGVFRSPKERVPCGFSAKEQVLHGFSIDDPYGCTAPLENCPVRRSSGRQLALLRTRTLPRDSVLK
ncbi:hypothetical protein SKAU_G00395700 [Synaphobranchus kaupii]|uniref:Uncharacterized protein n=1 Tax=Synaphobranchus kaupii TaxID=118154 RepID=A0A9Q1IE10_SYNKA|nr:hypothetical protein SKAU_G00395700 [Synaphobranchus kaupii]